MDDFDLSKQIIKPIGLEEEMKKSFISYAMATIISRALPDVRDGLKPVHRRILYAMHELGVTPDKPYRKSVRIVGDVLGKYHPHGDSAVYDAMVRMAQDFSTRYMLVDGHGNFGSIDGDGAAAMRYTEARMSRITTELLADIDKDTVDFVPNFDETQMQPSVLPTKFPNLLANGSNGIAVGMATNIPPHNLKELIAGTIAIIDNPDISTEELMEHIPGPDFPTAGLIMGRSGILRAYRTGKGHIIMRGATDIEEMSANRSRIVINEIPYQVNKARLVEKIAELAQTKRVEGISDIRDESDRSGMRIVIELKRDVNAQVVLNYLYRHTQLQETFGVNMLALVDGEPRTLSLKQMLVHYIDHQKEVITRRTVYDLNRAKARAHILEGLIKALDFIDAIIALIRSSSTPNEAKEGLMNQFGFSDKQAQAILDMRLQRLTGLERSRLMEEYEGLSARIAYLEGVLNDEAQLMDIIRTELNAVSDKYGDERRTRIMADPTEIMDEDLIQQENMVITMTHTGYIKRTSSAAYRLQGRGGVGIQGQSTRDEDYVDTLLHANTHDWLLMFTNTGRVHRLRCLSIPEAGRSARGTAVVNLIQLDPGEKVHQILCLSDGNLDVDDVYLVLATRSGLIKKSPLSEYSNLKNVGLRAINLQDDDELISVRLCKKGDEIMMFTRLGSAIRFSEDELRPVHRVAMGVQGIKLREGDVAVDMTLVDEADEKRLILLTEKGYGKRVEFSDFRLQSRSGFGVTAQRITEQTGAVIAAKTVSPDDDIMIVTSDGTIIRIKSSQISVIGRATKGVRIMRLREGDLAQSLAIAEPEEDDVPSAPAEQELPTLPEEPDAALEDEDDDI